MKWMQKKRLAVVLLACSLAMNTAHTTATVVEFQTVLGNFQVNLFDQTTPATVTNFLNYVNNGNYSDSIVHRSASGFVIQGGGFIFDGSLPLEDAVQNAPVTNEPLLSNVRGTLAMAKVGNDPNSATNQWYINLGDNTANLDGQNGGFTVFGVVTGSGMDVVDAVADLPRFDFGGPFDTVPLQNYTTDDANNGVDPDANNLIIISAIVVTDSTVNTGANLLPPANTTINPPVVTPTPTLSGGGGGGSGRIGLVSLLVLAGYTLLRRRKTDITHQSGLCDRT